MLGKKKKKDSGSVFCVLELFPLARGENIYLIVCKLVVKPFCSKFRANYCIVYTGSITSKINGRSVYGYSDIILQLLITHEKKIEPCLNYERQSLEI